MQERTHPESVSEVPRIAPQQVARSAPRPDTRRLTMLQRSAGNAAVARWLSRRSRTGSRPLSRLEIGPPNAATASSGGIAVTWAAVDINTLTARDCWYYLSTLNDARNQAALATLPALIERGTKDTLRVSAGDKAALETRLKTQIPNALAELQNAMRGSAAVFTARNIASPNVPGSAMNLPPSAQPIEEQLVALIDSAQKETRIVGFDEWLMGKLIMLVDKSGGSSAEQRQQHADTINELRETFAQLKGTPGTTTADVRETAVPGSHLRSPTADITLADTGARGGQVEVKTVRTPIEDGQALIGQLGPACAKFQQATHADNTAVVYASYDTAKFPKPNDASDPATKAAADHVLTRLKAKGALQGKENCRTVIVRMENGRSFKFDQAGGALNWTLAWL